MIHRIRFNQVERLSSCSKLCSSSRRHSVYNRRHTVCSRHVTKHVTRHVTRHVTEHVTRHVTSRHVTTGTNVYVSWLDLFEYFRSENVIELRVVTELMKKKLLADPFDKMYFLDNEEMVKRVLKLSQSEDDKLRFNARHILHCIGIVPKQRDGIRILSIDGGGTRGVIAISVLKKLEALTNKRVYEMFDYCIGTSTGALLIALLIASRRPLDEVLDIYLNLSKEVFGGRSVLAVGRFVWRHSRYSTETWENLLKNECKDWKMSEVSCFDGSPLIAFVSSVVNHEIVHPYVFRSYELPLDLEERKYRGGYQHRIWQGLRATTAAPSYFSEIQLGQDVHIDGALLYNNPTALGIREAKRVWPDDKIQCVVSIGAGQIPWQYRPASARVPRPSSLRDTLNHVIWGATDTRTTHLTLQDLLDRHIYFRFNPLIKEITPLDEINNGVLDNLRKQTNHFVRNNTEMFTLCATALKADSNPSKPTSPWKDLNKQL